MAGAISNSAARGPAPSHPSRLARREAGHRVQGIGDAVDHCTLLPTPCPQPSSAICGGQRRQHSCAVVRQSRPPRANPRSRPGRRGGKLTSQNLVKSKFRRSSRELGAQRQRCAGGRRIGILGMTTVTAKRQCRAHADQMITGLAQLSRVLGRIAQLANVIGPGGRENVFQDLAVGETRYSVSARMNAQWLTNRVVVLSRDPP